MRQITTDSERVGAPRASAPAPTCVRSRVLTGVCAIGRGEIASARDGS